MIRTAAALLLASLATAAATSANAQSVYGYGGGPCSGWTANYKKKSYHLADMGWATGYLSGVNRGRGPGSNLLAGAGAEAVDGFITQFCAANPGEPIYKAADAFIADIDRQRGALR